MGTSQNEESRMSVQHDTDVKSDENTKTKPRGINKNEKHSTPQREDPIDGQDYLIGKTHNRL